MTLTHDDVRTRSQDRWPMLGPVLQHALEVAVPFPPQLVTAAFPFDAPLIGALALGVEAAAVGIGEEALT